MSYGLTVDHFMRRVQSQNFALANPGVTRWFDATATILILVSDDQNLTDFSSHLTPHHALSAQLKYPEAQTCSAPGACSKKLTPL